MLSDNDKFYLAMRCINDIDDFLEYQYKSCKNIDEVKSSIMKYIDKFTNKLSNQHKNWKDK